MKNENQKDPRLLGALDFIDSDLIGETADRLMKPIAAKKRFFTTARLALIAACLCLIALIIPVILTLAGIDTSITVYEEDPPIPPHGANEDTVSKNTNVYDGSRGLIYRISDDGTYAMLVDIGVCTDKDITVASSYNGLPVKIILFGAMRDCETIESVTFPDSVERIIGSVLSNCPNLRRIYIGAGVKTIIDGTFSENELDEIVISPDNPYYVCRNNCVIEIATKTLVIGYKGAVIPDDGSVEVIGYRAFSQMRGVTSLVIPEGIKKIGASAFEDCEFESITLPGSLERLGEGVFRNCKNLKYFDLGGYHELPDSVLRYCDALREVVGLENVTYIGSHSLSGDYLTSINLTASLKYIDQWAFSNAQALSHIYFDGTVAEWNAIPKGYDQNYRLPVGKIFCSDGMGDPKTTLPKE